MGKAISFAALQRELAFVICNKHTYIHTPRVWLIKRKEKR